MKPLFLCWLLIFSTQSHGYVAREERVLLVVSELDSTGAPEMRDLYRITEELTLSAVNIFLKPYYGEVQYLLGHEATIPNFKKALLEMSHREDIMAIDVILSLHGSEKKLTFFDKKWKLPSLEHEFIKLNSTSLRKKLRMMYNLSCYGSYHNASFIKMGFDASVGSVAVNANSEIEFIPFLNAWREGHGFQKSFDLTNNDFALNLSDAPIKVYGEWKKSSLSKTNSKKIFVGNTELRIASDAQ